MHDYCFGKVKVTQLWNFQILSELIKYMGNMKHTRMSSEYNILMHIWKNIFFFNLLFGKPFFFFWGGGGDVPLVSSRTFMINTGPILDSVINSRQYQEIQPDQSPQT